MLFVTVFVIIANDRKTVTAAVKLSKYIANGSEIMLLNPLRGSTLQCVAGRDLLHRASLVLYGTLM